VPVPRLYLIASEQANAFATGRNPRHAAVAVTEGLLEQLPADQVRGVLAHEFAHIKNDEILISSIAAMVAGAISAIASVLQFSRCCSAALTSECFRQGTTAKPAGGKLGRQAKTALTLSA